MRTTTSHLARACAFVCALLFLSASAPAAELRPFVRGSWQEVLAANAARPAVVHFWGLTCAPCLTELPHWAEFRRARPGLRLVMIAADPAPADANDLATTLDKAGLNGVESWAFADPFSERLRYEIDAKWRGEMPRTILVGRDGTTKVMIGLADLRAVGAWYDAETAKP